LTFDKVTDKNKLAVFMAHGVYGTCIKYISEQ